MRGSSRTPFSGYGRLALFQCDTAACRTFEADRNAGCFVSSSFLLAESEPDSASNGLAASSFCSGAEGAPQPRPRDVQPDRRGVLPEPVGGVFTVPLLLLNQRYLRGLNQRDLRGAVVGLGVGQVFLVVSRSPASRRADQQRHTPLLVRGMKNAPANCRGA